MNETFKKYQIDAYLEKLSHKDLRDAKLMLPKILNISVNTLGNYRNINHGTEQDIPYEIVKKLEILLNLRPGELINYNITGLGLEQALEEYRKRGCNLDDQAFIQDIFFQKEFIPYPRMPKVVYFVDAPIKIETITQLTKSGIKIIKDVLSMTRSEFLNHGSLSDLTKLEVINYLHSERLYFSDDKM